jgi:hypothetical protein
MTTADWLQLAVFAVVLVAAVIIAARTVLVVIGRETDRDKNFEDKLQDIRERAATMYANMEAAHSSALRRMDDLEDEVSRLREENARLQAEVDSYRQIIAVVNGRVQALELGASILTQQLKRHSLDPEWAPEDAVMVPVPVRPQELADRIRRAFNVEEMNDLATRLEIDPEDIAERTATGRARALVGAAERRGKLGLLIETAKELRPKGNW